MRIVCVSYSLRFRRASDILNPERRQCHASLLAQTITLNDRRARPRKRRWESWGKPWVSCGIRGARAMVGLFAGASALSECSAVGAEREATLEGDRP